MDENKRLTRAQLASWAEFGAPTRPAPIAWWELALLALALWGVLGWIDWS